MWTEEDRGRFLAGALELVPGTTRSIKVPDAREGREIIESLGKLRD